MRSSLSILTAALAAGCAMGDATPGVVVTDSAGVTITESAGPAWAEGRGWIVADAPLLSIGALDGDDAYVFHEAFTALRLSNGVIVVGDRGSRTLRLFDADGRHLRTVGRQGSGPGEFRSLSSVQRIAGDTLVVWDGGLRRVSTVDAAGEFVGEVSAALLGNSPIQMIRRLDDGRWLVSWEPSLSGAGGFGVHRRTAVVGVAATDLSPADTIGTWPGLEFSVVQTAGGGMSIGPSPWGRALALAPRGAEIIVANSKRMGYDVAGNDGAIRASVRVPMDLRMTDAHRQELLAAALAQARDGDTEFARAWYGGDGVPQHRAAFRGVLVDTGGNVWLGPAGSPAVDPRRWIVFDVGGRYLGVVVMPEGFTPSDVGDDWILGVTRDDLGVERVQLFALRR